LIHFYKRYNLYFYQMGLLNFITGMFTGLYAGIYLTQNYNVPALPDPTTLVDKAKKFLEENKKPGKSDD